MCISLESLIYVLLTEVIPYGVEPYLFYIYDENGICKKKGFLLTLLANVLRIKVIRHPDKKETQLSVLRGQRSLQYGIFYIAVR